MVRVVHGELLDDHGEFFIQRLNDGSPARCESSGGDPAAADAAQWHHGVEVPGCISTSGWCRCHETKQHKAKVMMHTRSCHIAVQTVHERNLKAWLALLPSHTPFQLQLELSRRTCQVSVGALPPGVSLVTAEAVLFCGKAQRILLRWPGGGKARLVVAPAPSAAVQLFAETLRDMQRQPSLDQIRLERAVTAVHGEVRAVTIPCRRREALLGVQALPRESCEVSVTCCERGAAWLR